MKFLGIDWSILIDQHPITAVVGCLGYVVALVLAMHWATRPRAPAVDDVAVGADEQGVKHAQPNGASRSENHG